jgi:hypothetical protein
MQKTSTYKGVHWDKSCNKFRAMLIYKGVTYNCGFANSEIEAVKLRDLLIIRRGFPQSKLQIIKPTKKT